jgi:phosphoadenosine phosphosulfate reductase
MIEPNKVKVAIETIQKAESLALKYQDYGFCLAFSGGKDSIVIYKLCEMAGVKFKPVMNLTTVDPPEMMRFIRKNYPQVELVRPIKNFYQIIIDYQSLPTMTKRFCCKELKEQSGAGTVTIIGIRRAESNKRAKRNELEISGRKYSNSLDQFNIDNESQILCIKGKDKILLSPIINWSNSDVWTFIRDHNMPYCELYDQGYQRVGCMFCPYCTPKSKIRDLNKYPLVAREIKKSISKLCDMGKYTEFNNDVDEIFNWWICNKSSKVYLAQKQQLKLNL